jgi:ABC-type Zn uptake system ZnuABC Zn-binding protein ZnuA
MPVWLRAVALLALALLMVVPPVAAQEGARTFPETGFTVRGIFLRYWEANGGLAQQGLPVSAELTEGGRTVQYFERARFEHHPEHAGTRYEVLLGLIGRDAYGQRYPAAVFTPTAIPEAGFPGGVGRRFPETGYAVPAVFLQAWERFGGLPQQGYPVSAVFREGPYLVQYFERARFEHHPEFAGTNNEVLLGLLGRAAHGRAYAAPRSPVRAVGSFSILSDLIKSVGGDKVQVASIVPADTDSHEFEPSPQDVLTIAQGQVLFLNGLNFEEWLTDLIANAGNPNLRQVTLSDRLPVLGAGGPDPEHAAGNPHLWLDVSNAMAYVMVIRDILGELDPANAPTYDANAAAYLALLQRLDFAIYSEVQTIPVANRKMVTFHDAWPYFATRYGLKNFPVHQANPEGELSAQEYAELVDLIRSEGIKVLFGEAGFNPKILQQLARDTGVTFVDGLHGDTLAPSGLPSTYVGMMQYDISLIVNSLR